MKENLIVILRRKAPQSCFTRADERFCEALLFVTTFSVHVVIGSDMSSLDLLSDGALRIRVCVLYGVVGGGQIG